MMKMCSTYKPQHVTRITITTIVVIVAFVTIIIYTHICRKTSTSSCAACVNAAMPSVADSSSMIASRFSSACTQVTSI